jgi:hypothetical protein
MDSILVNRPMSGFPVSIATSLALETLFTPTIAVADESREVPEKVDPSTYDLYLLNVSTILRNLIQSVPWRDLSTVNRKDVADAFLEEIDFLTGFFSAAGLNAKFYWNSYSYPLKTYADKIRKPTTPQQMAIAQLMDYCTGLVRKQDDVLTFSKDLHVDRGAKCLLLSHVPWDLLSYGNFHKLDLLESHTGRVKSRKDWNTKYFPIKDKDFSFLPFMEYLLVKLGDGVLFTPDPLKERLELWEVLKKKRVHPLMSELSLGFMMGRG